MTYRQKVKRSSLARKIAIQYLKEYKRGYYLNAANIKERIHLKEPERLWSEKFNDYYTHFEYLTIYFNGYEIMDKINVHLSGFPDLRSLKSEVSRPKVKKKNNQRVKYSTKRRRDSN